jgi:hypothetical protein
MSVQFIEDYEHGYKVLYCTTTMMPFGLVMYEEDDVEDARLYTKGELIDLYYKWREEVENGEHD